MKTISELYKQPCTCKLCPAGCYGTGKLDSVENGDASLEPCERCGESGFIYVCNRCSQINVLLTEQEELAAAA